MGTYRGPECSRREFLKYLALGGSIVELIMLSSCDVRDPKILNFVNHLIERETPIPLCLLEGWDLFRTLKPGEARVTAPGEDEVSTKIDALFDVEWKADMRYQNPVAYIRCSESQIYEGGSTQTKDANSDSFLDFLNNSKRNLLLHTEIVHDPTDSGIIGPTHSFFIVVGDKIPETNPEAPFSLRNPQVILVKPGCSK